MSVAPGAWMTEHWAELSGMLLGIGYVVLSVRQKILAWPLGLLSSLVYVLVFSQSGFYAGMGLQGYYVFISIYGWVTWKKGSDNPSGMLEVSRMGKTLALKTLLATALFCTAIFFVLKYWTDSPVPFGDAFTTSLGIVATWMMARKILENWLVWIVSDTVAICLYLFRGLELTAILYLAYASLAVTGYLQWKKSIQNRAL